MEKLHHVILDFEGVSAIAQAFADEILRVYANSHSDTVLLPVKMEPNVEKMANLAASTKMGAA